MPILCSFAAGLMSVLACGGSADSTAPEKPAPITEVTSTTQTPSSTSGTEGSSSTASNQQHEQAGATQGQEQPVATRTTILYGVHSDVSWYTDAAFRVQAIDSAKALHAEVMRIGVFWMWIEYARGHRNWTVLDDVVNRLSAAGIQPIFNVIGSPPWASGVLEKDDSYFYLNVPTDSAQFTRWVADYADFVSAVASRYNGKVKMWEIGNEENDAFFWRPKANVDQYARWYVALRNAIKAVNSNAIVAIGGLNSLGYDIDAKSVRGPVLLKGLYARKIYPDAIAIHPYSNHSQSPDVHLNNFGNFDDITLIRKAMMDNGQSTTPVWLTEWGWNVNNVTPEVQADYVRKSLEILDSQYASYVTVATYFNEFDPTSGDRYGLYDHNFVMRPAGVAFRDFLAKR